MRSKTGDPKKELEELVLKAICPFSCNECREVVPAAIEAVLEYLRPC